MKMVLALHSAKQIPPLATPKAHTPFRKVGQVGVSRREGCREARRIR